MAALMLSVMIAVWLGVFGPLNLAAIEKWQTLVAAGVAAAGIAVAALMAVRNVSRQIRVNILLREEDRIEKQLPGLREAASYLADISHRCGHGKVFEGVHEAVAKDFKSSPQKTIETALPQTDPIIRKTVEALVFRCYNLAWAAEAALRRANRRLEPPEKWAAGEYDKAVAELFNDTERLEEATKNLGAGLRDIAAEIRALGAKADSYERRLTHIRSEIERYFADEKS